MDRPSTVKDITDAVMYLIEAATVTSHILYVDGGAHFVASSLVSPTRPSARQSNWKSSSK
jgi:hypothetical protein